ncbi:mCG4148 [Mus musculus]|nr:mCG4148 [Mus musculus]
MHTHSHTHTHTYKESLTPGEVFLLLLLLLFYFKHYHSEASKLYCLQSLRANIYILCPLRPVFETAFSKSHSQACNMQSINQSINQINK